MQVWRSNGRGRRPLALLALLFMVMAHGGAAAAEDRPLIQLETGGPMAMVRSIVFTGHGQAPRAL